MMNSHTVILQLADHDGIRSIILLVFNRQRAGGMSAEITFNYGRAAEQKSKHSRDHLSLSQSESVPSGYPRFRRRRP